MNRLLRLLRGKAPLVLDKVQRNRVDDWQHGRAAGGEASNGTLHRQARYVVADVETSGLNLRSDRLIAIGAVGVKAGLIDTTDAFEVVLRQEQASDTGNILIHGIGGMQQRGGVHPVEALLGFLEFLGDDTLVAYHAAFDEVMIARAMAEVLGLRFRPLWIDLAWILPRLYPEIHDGPASLDLWLDAFGIPVLVRHNALADALATAHLLQMVLPRAVRAGAVTPRGLAEMEKARRWLRQGG